MGLVPCVWGRGKKPFGKRPEEDQGKAKACVPPGGGSWTTVKSSHKEGGNKKGGMTILHTSHRNNPLSREKSKKKGHAKKKKKTHGGRMVGKNQLAIVGVGSQSVVRVVFGDKHMAG